MSDPIESLLQEVKRQGRASVAAQASAEACLAAVGALAAKIEAAAPPETARFAWLEALLPVFDGLDRLTEAAATERVGPPWARRSAPHADGLRILQSQLGRTLRGLGVDKEAPLGMPFDAGRHRAVSQVRRSGVVEPTVDRVVAPGYVVGDVVLREAEVVVAVPELSR